MSLQWKLGNCFFCIFSLVRTMNCLDLVANFKGFVLIGEKEWNIWEIGHPYPPSNTFPGEVWKMSSEIGTPCRVDDYLFMRWIPPKCITPFLFHGICGKIELRLARVNEIQKRPLNVITLGHTKTDNIIRRITKNRWFMLSNL